MPLTINTNVASLNAQRHLGTNTNMLQTSMEKLSSGYRINHAGDDAAGLQLSEKLRSQIRGMTKANDNTQDGINVLNSADGAMQQITDNLQRIRELTVQGANETYSTAQRTAVTTEINAMIADIDRIAASTKFNGISLLDNNVPASFSIQVGANNTANDSLSILGGLGDMRATGGGVNLASAAFTNNATAQTYLATVDTAIDAVNTKRGTIGSLVNRLQGASNNLQIGIENQSASESRIRNVDVAAESAKLTQAQILQQASAAMLSQANQSPSLAMKLLQG